MFNIKNKNLASKFFREKKEENICRENFLTVTEKEKSIPQIIKNYEEPSKESEISSYSNIKIKSENNSNLQSSNLQLINDKSDKNNIFLILNQNNSEINKNKPISKRIIDKKIDSFKNFISMNSINCNKDNFENYRELYEKGTIKYNNLPNENIVMDKNKKIFINEKQDYGNLDNYTQINISKDLKKNKDNKNNNDNEIHISRLICKGFSEQNKELSNRNLNLPSYTSVVNNSPNGNFYKEENDYSQEQCFNNYLISIENDNYNSNKNLKENCIFSNNPSKLNKKILPDLNLNKEDSPEKKNTIKEETNENKNTIYFNDNILYNDFKTKKDNSLFVKNLISEDINQCMICEELNSDLTKVQINCNHKFCKKCIKTIIEDRIENKDYFLKCPIYFCTGIFKLREIKQIIGTKHFLVLYQLIRDEFYIHELQPNVMKGKQTINNKVLKYNYFSEDKNRNSTNINTLKLDENILNNIDDLIDNPDSDHKNEMEDIINIINFKKDSNNSLKQGINKKNTIIEEIKIDNIHTKNKYSDCKLNQNSKIKKILIKNNKIDQFHSINQKDENDFLEKFSILSDPNDIGEEYNKTDVKIKNSNKEFYEPKYINENEKTNQINNYISDKINVKCSSSRTENNNIKYINLKKESSRVNKINLEILGKEYLKRSESEISKIKNFSRFKLLGNSFTNKYEQKNTIKKNTQKKFERKSFKIKTIPFEKFFLNRKSFKCKTIFYKLKKNYIRSNFRKHLPFFNKNKRIKFLLNKDQTNTKLMSLKKSKFGTKIKIFRKNMNKIENNTIKENKDLILKFKSDHYIKSNNEFDSSYKEINTKEFKDINNKYDMNINFNDNHEILDAYDKNSKKCNKYVNASKDINKNFRGNIYYHNNNTTLKNSLNVTNNKTGYKSTMNDTLKNLSKKHILEISNNQTFFMMNRFKDFFCNNCGEPALFAKLKKNFIKCLNCFSKKCRYCMKNYTENHYDLSCLNRCKYYYKKNFSYSTTKNSNKFSYSEKFDLLKRQLLNFILMIASYSIVVFFLIKTTNKFLHFEINNTCADKQGDSFLRKIKRTKILKSLRFSINLISSIINVFFWVILSIFFIPFYPILINLFECYYL